MTEALACPPRLSTSRTDRPTYGGKAAAIASMIRRPMMPWQRHVADVALEVDPKTGRLVYNTVILSVPRQSGKSTLLLSMILLRGLAFGPRQEMVYTAQNRQSARDKWEHDFIETLRVESGFKEKRDFFVRTSNGFEHLKFANGSRQSLTALGKASGHGMTLDLAMIDEAFACTDSRADASFGPPMSTRPEAQLWVVSTKGTWQSVYLNAKLELGAAAVADGRSKGVAYFDWSAPPEADLWDEKVWAMCMPALGYTQNPDSIRTLIEQMNDEDEARRAYLNIGIDETKDRPAGMDLEAWAAQTDPGSKISGRAVLGVDVSPDRSWAALSVAGVRPDGAAHIELIERRVGTAWVAGRAASVATKWKLAGIAVEKSSPAGSLIHDLEEWGLEVITLAASDHARAAGALYDRLRGESGSGARVWHLGQDPLDFAAAEATRRALSDAWVWDRRKKEITALISCTLALGALLKLPPPKKPSVYDRRGMQTV